MQLDLPAEMILTLLLAAARAGAFLAIAPPFASRAIPGPVKALLSVAIALPVVSAGKGRVPGTDTASIVSALVLQVVVGAALGFLCLLIFSAASAAGDLLDVFGGFSLSFALDPLMQSGNAVFGKFFQMVATTLLLTSGGYLILLQGFLRSFDAVPLDGGLDLATLVSVLTSGVGQMLLAALQICAPLLGVLFLADVALGLLTRVAPALNAFSLGFPFKILLTLLLVGTTIAGLPQVVAGLADLAGSTMVRVFEP
ncbi:MAG TPA: flagellar biosynthetic protein FliR [Actinomycetales bacterium]|jgi:flagellar biosynthetic protein FliR